MEREKFYLYWLNQPEVRKAILTLYKKGRIERWNPISGCCYTCVYCWARELALTRLRHTERYRNGFIPRLNEKDLKRKFRKRIVFVGFMSDMWADCIPDSWIRRVLEHLQDFDDGSHLFFFLTKNPARYRDYIDMLPRHSYLGTTIETNRDEYFINSNISNAPLPSKRYKAFLDIKWHWKNLTIEPIMEFDLDIFVQWINNINPVIIFIGYDSFRIGLPEPPLNKVLKLINILETKYFVAYRYLRNKVRHRKY